MENKYNIHGAVISRMRKRNSIVRDNIFLLLVGPGTNVYNDFTVFNTNEFKQKTSDNKFFKVGGQMFYGTICGLNASNWTGYLLRRKGRLLQKGKIFQQQEFLAKFFHAECP